MNLVGGADNVVGNRILVRNFPPPLMPGDINRQHWPGRHAVNVARNRKIIDEEKEQNRNHHQYGQFDGALCSVFAWRRGRIVGGVASVADDGEECGDDEDVGNDRDRHHEVKELMCRCCLRADGIENGLSIVAGAGDRSAYQRTRDWGP